MINCTTVRTAIIALLLILSPVPPANASLAPYQLGNSYDNLVTSRAQGSYNGIEQLSLEGPQPSDVGPVAYFPLIVRAGNSGSIIVTPVQVTNSSGNTVVHLPEADLDITTRDASGAAVADIKVVVLSDGQRALVVVDDEQHRFYPSFQEVPLPQSQPLVDDTEAIPIIVVAIVLVDAAISAYGIIQFVQDPPTVIATHPGYVEYCSTVRQMSNTVGVGLLASWAIPGTAGHVIGIGGGLFSALVLEDLLEDYWCANNLPHPIVVRQHNIPGIALPWFELGGACPGLPPQPICQRPTSVVSGVVRDARTGLGLAGAQVKVEPSGPSSVTNSNGQYTISSVAVGYHTITASRTGYVSSGNTVEVGASPATVDFTLSPEGSGTEYRFVLTWGAYPSDLDSHLWLPAANSFHVYYANRGSLTAHPFAFLDRDDTSSYGPETITMIRTYAGSYLYAVYQFSSYGSLTTSGAQVAIYQGSTLLRTVSVPTTGSGRWWVVASVDGGTGALAVHNYLSSANPGPYHGPAHSDK